MKKNFIITFCLLFVLFAAIYFFVQSTTVEEFVSTQPVVSATIFPLYDIVRIIGKDIVDVQLILPPGASPHTYEATPQTVKMIEKSLRVFAIGHGFDSWATAYINDQQQLVLVDKNLLLKDSAESDHTSVSNDPHYWLDVSNAQQIAKTVAEELIQLEPSRQETIKLNLDAYLTELADLDSAIRAQLMNLSEKKLITFHEAWYYFADAYGLNIVATFEPQPGREPTPRDLADLTEIFQEYQLKVMYTEPQFSSSSIKSFLSDLQITLAQLDPIGGTPEVDSYIELMQSNVFTLTHNQ